MNNTELNENIKRLRRAAFFDFLISLLMVLLFFVVILLLIAKLWLAALSFVFIFLVSLTIFLLKNKKIKNKLASSRLQPYKIELSNNYSAETLTQLLCGQCEEKDIFIYNDSVTMAKTDEQLQFRILIYKSEDFTKSDYDYKKSRANRAFNKKYSVSQWVDSPHIARMMRLNIIYSDNMNEELYRYMSANAWTGLTRAEGTIVFAVCKNIIYIPPLAGDLTVLDVSRYKKSVEFMASKLP